MTNWSVGGSFGQLYAGGRQTCHSSFILWLPRSRDAPRAKCSGKIFQVTTGEDKSVIDLANGITAKPEAAEWDGRRSRGRCGLQGPSSDGRH